jgi:hypothetical protein
MSVTPTHVFNKIARHIFTDNELKTFLKVHAGVKRAGATKIELLKFYINFALERGCNIKHQEDVMNYPFLTAISQQEICHDYVSLRNACFIMHGGYSQAEGVCKHIIGFTDAFHHFINNKLASISIKKLRPQSSYPSTSIPYSCNLAYSAPQMTPEGNQLVLDYFWPGDNDSNYKTSPNSFRRFCGAGRIEKQLIEAIYEGFVDFDINNCYANIFIKWCAEQGVQVPEDMLQVRDNKHDFYERIIADNCFDFAGRQTLEADGPHAAAKVMLLKLFHPPANGRRPRTKVDWYDNLASFVDSVFFNTSIDDAHYFFSKIEAQIIKKAIMVVGPTNFGLDKHDGFIADIKHEDVKQLLEQLERETGYRWKARILSKGETK